MRTRLNDLTIRSLKTDAIQADFWDATLPGFGVRVSRRGTKTFILKHKNKRYTLGRYPFVTLRNAREEARRRIALKYLPPSALPAKQLIATYLQCRRPDLRPISYYRMERLLTAYFPNLSIGTVTAADIYAALLPLAPSHRNLAFAFFKAFLTWCVEQNHLAKSPIANSRLPHRRKSRDRLLTDDEIRSIWCESHTHDVFGAIVRSLILSGQRRSQITQFQHSWIKDDTIVFPAFVMKTNEDHTIPVTERLRAHLPSQPRPFRSHSSAMRKFREALKADLAPNGALVNNLEHCAQPSIPHFTLHDFRRYFSSTMAKLRVPIDITEALLSHKAGSRSPIQRTYDVYTRLEPMRDALQKYEHYLFSTVLTEQSRNLLRQVPRSSVYAQIS